MARTTNTEKATARSARPAAHPGGTRLGGVDQALSRDGLRFRAMLNETRVEADEEGGLRLVTLLPPLPKSMEKLIREQAGSVRPVDRGLVLRAIDRLPLVIAADRRVVRA